MPIVPSFVSLHTECPRADVNAASTQTLLAHPPANRFAQMMQPLQNLVERQIKTIQHILPPYTLGRRHDIVHLPAAQPLVPLLAVDTLKHHAMQHLRTRVQKLQRRVDTDSIQPLLVAIRDAIEVGQLERGVHVAQIFVGDDIHAVGLVQTGGSLGQETVRADSHVAAHGTANLVLQPLLNFHADTL